MSGTHRTAMRTFLAALLCTTVGPLAAQPTAPPVSVPTSALWTLTRQETGERYEISVRTPQGGDATTPRPLLFVLDGTEDFALAAALADITRSECEARVAPLVVAIGDGARIDAPGNRRGRDYTPSVSTVSWARGDGGAAGFLRFVSDEVLPFVAARYPVSGPRTLFGYSYGGLFAAYALLERPALFDQWVLGSPSVFYDSALVVRRARDVPAAALAHPPRILLTAGSKESWAVDGNRDFVAALRHHFGPQVDVTSITLPDVGHAMGKVGAMVRGFAWANCAAPKASRGGVP